MAKAVASQEVANMLNDWYILMKNETFQVQSK